MGIYDREYYRDETGGSGWLSGIAPTCKALLLINIATYIAQLVFPGLTDALQGKSDAIVENFEVWRLLTATFVHDVNTPFPILWNMLFLWFAGREMESLYGTRDFRWMYLTAAVVSTLAWTLLNQFGPENWRGTALLMGASGPVTAIMVLYALHYPRREVLLFFILPVEIWLLLVLYLGLQAFMLLQAAGGGESAIANLTGAAYGYLFKTFDLRWTRLGQRRRPRFRVIAPEPREKPTTRSVGPTWSPEPAAAPRPSTTTVVTDESLEEKLDEVLAKIAREGRGALTEEDHRVLQEASRQAKNRRSDRL